MARPTDNDWNLFATVSNADKAAVLFAYLCQGYNMVEVAQNTLHDYNDMASQRVSNITRCYGFSGKNGGKYRRYNLSLKDIEGFVKKYPDGCDDYRIMDEYVRKLYESRQQSVLQQGSSQVGSTQQQKMQRKSVQQNTAHVYTQKPSASTQENSYEEFQQDRPVTRAQQKLARIILLIGVAAILVCKFILSWNLIVSIIVGIVVAGLVAMFLNQ